MLKGIIFDLDGVLTDTAEFHYQAWKELGEKIDIPIDRAFNERLKGVSRKESLERILEHGGKSKEYTEEEKAVLAEEKNERYQELIASITPENVLPGILQFIAACKAENMKLAVASASRNAPFLLMKLNLASAFDAAADAAALKKGKPDPEIFLKSAELLGLLPEECAGIEDAEAGVEAIRRAGMFSVGIGTSERIQKADLSVKQTADLDLEKIIKVFNIKMKKSK